MGRDVWVYGKQRELSRVRLCETVVDSRYEVVTKGKSAWDDR